jgi:hypothetical protein
VASLCVCVSDIGIAYLLVAKCVAQGAMLKANNLEADKMFCVFKADRHNSRVFKSDNIIHPLTKQLPDWSYDKYFYINRQWLRSSERDIEVLACFLKTDSSDHNFVNSELG